MIYDIRLRLTHAYPASADTARHRLHVRPLDLPDQQRVLQVRTESDPVAAAMVEGQDFFGNASLLVVHDQTHSQMQIRMEARVERLQQDERFDTSPLVTDLAAEVEGVRHLGSDSPHHFLSPSVRVAQSAPITEFARKALPRGASVKLAVQAIGLALHDAMQFDGSATTVDTPTEVAFVQRRGVCQDYAHIMIAALRGLGIPARYASGFLRTEPPEGQARLDGADAMHAWVSAWCGRDLGWQDYDPTNAISVRQDHVVVAYGRDYFDVSPIKGRLRGGGLAMVSQAVDVIPVEADA